MWTGPFGLGNDEAAGGTLRPEARLSCSRTAAPRLDGEALPAVRDRDARRAFAESILVEALNPKAAMFYLAFLPQFVDAGAAWPAWAQFLVLGWIVNLTFSLADLVTVALAARLLAGLRRSPAAARVFRIAGGTTLMGLGIQLAVSRQ